MRSLIARSMRKGRCDSILQKFSDGTHAAVAEMVDVIDLSLAGAQVDEIRITARSPPRAVGDGCTPHRDRAACSSLAANRGKMVTLSD